MNNTEEILDMCILPVLIYGWLINMDTDKDKALEDYGSSRGKWSVDYSTSCAEIR